MKELNEKLAKWRWPDGHIVLFKNLQIISVIDKDEDISTTIEYFTHSTDAIFKWLVPELNRKGFYICINQHDYGSGLEFEVIIVDEIGDDTTDLHTNKELTLAVARAIEQVIDNDENNS